jgi:hypothetical protein
MPKLFFSNDRDTYTLAEIEMVARVYLAQSHRAKTRAEARQLRENARRLIDLIHEHWSLYGFDEISEQQLRERGMTT